MFVFENFVLYDNLSCFQLCTTCVRVFKFYTVQLQKFLTTKISQIAVRYIVKFFTLSELNKFSCISNLIFATKIGAC